MSTISAHGGLVHVVLCVKSVTSEGVTVLVRNSPNLLTFHICIDKLGNIDKDNLEATLKEKLKLLTMGSYELVQGIHLKGSEHNTNLLSLWTTPFSFNVTIRNFTSINDTLSTDELDNHHEYDEKLAKYHSLYSY